MAATLVLLTHARLALPRSGRPPSLQAHLMGPCSLLAFDPVPNVQLKAAALLPALKQASR